MAAQYFVNNNFLNQYIDPCNTSTSILDYSICFNQNEIIQLIHQEDSLKTKIFKISSSLITSFFIIIKESLQEDIRNNISLSNNYQSNNNNDITENQYDNIVTFNLSPYQIIFNIVTKFYNENEHFQCFIKCSISSNYIRPTYFIVKKNIVQETIQKLLSKLT